MATKVVALMAAGLMMAGPAFGQTPPKKTNPIMALKNHAFAVCIAKGLGPGEAADKAGAAAREYVEHGTFPIEAYTEAAQLSQTFLARDYKNIYGDDLVFIKCLDFYHSVELDRLARKYSRGQGRKLDGG
jgi:hypothetical protein